MAPARHRRSPCSVCGELIPDKLSTHRVTCSDICRQEVRRMVGSDVMTDRILNGTHEGFTPEIRRKIRIAWKRTWAAKTDEERQAWVDRLQGDLEAALSPEERAALARDGMNRFWAKRSSARFRRRWAKRAAAGMKTPEARARQSIVQTERYAGMTAEERREYMRPAVNASAQKKKDATHCRRGHDDDWRIDYRGDRYCGTCRNDRRRAWRARRKAAGLPHD